MHITPFRVAVPQATLDDLRDRLARTRWPDALVGDGWDAGTDRAYLREFVAYWRDDFDWRAQEAALNRFAHFRAEVDGLGVHFVHARGVSERGRGAKGATPLPLLLAHGWPDSFWRMSKIIPLLTDPAAHRGDAEDAFDVVAPSLPGFGFSDKPERVFGMQDAAELFHTLLTKGLGYDHYGAHGGDLGSRVAEALARHHKTSVVGIHLTDVPVDHALTADEDDLSPKEQAVVKAAKAWELAEGAYAHEHATKPQTLAFGLNDSPAGLASWVVEKFRAWSDCDGRLVARPVLRRGAPPGARRQRPHLRRSGRHGAVPEGHLAPDARVGRAVLRRAAVDGDEARRPLRGPRGAGAARRGHPRLLPPAAEVRGRVARERVSGATRRGIRPPHATPDATMPTPAVGYAAKSKRADLKPVDFAPRDLGAHDVAIDVQYCGVCHSDVHQARDEWGNTVWPCLPGHEIVGRVAAVGGAVTTHRAGDFVAVGCMVDSCRQCGPCRRGLEQYCEGPQSWLATYNGPMKPEKAGGGTNAESGYPENTFGGYSDHVVVSEHFVLRVPEALAGAGNAGLASVAPLLCSAITTYSPLRHWKVGPGQTVGVVGLGGLGHVAVKLAKALGAEVVVFTTSKKAKEADARRFGASDVVDSTDTKAVAAYESKLDFVLDTIPEAHDVNPYAELLTLDGTVAVVGLLGPFKAPTDNQQVVMHRRSVAGSSIGGIAETQEVLDFCAEHGITSEVEVIPIQEVNDACDKVVNKKVRYRYVIDRATLAEDRDGAKGGDQVA